jgi:uncharacterized protein YdhG (YjbR/CyaY superfamily)
MLNKHLAVADYIEQYPSDIKEILLKIREIIKEVVPNSEELIRYGMLVFCNIHFMEPIIV